MAADAMTSGNVAVNPRPTTLEDITRLYRQAMYEPNKARSPFS